MRRTRRNRAPGRSRASLWVWFALLTASLAGHMSAQSLRGSRSSLDLQTAEAAEHDFSYVLEPDEVRKLAVAGALVRVNGNQDYRLKDVSFPFARPAVKLFIERLASQYRRACGQQLVVTSLTRPQSMQPGNASERSVHPTGMALDLRRPSGRCRSWLEAILLSLESESVLEATSERRPPHYHVAVFPEQYKAYVERLRAHQLHRSARRHAVGHCEDPRGLVRYTAPDERVVFGDDPPRADIDRALSAALALPGCLGTASPCRPPRRGSAGSAVRSVLQWDR